MRPALRAVACLTLLYGCSDAPAHTHAPSGSPSRSSARPAPQLDDSAHGDSHGHAVVFDRRESDATSVVIESDVPIRRLGLRFDSFGLNRLRFRERDANGTWGQWRDAEITWRDGQAYVARAVLHEAVAVEVETAHIEWASIEISEDSPAWLGRATAAQLPVEPPVAVRQPDLDDVASVGQAATQPDWIVSRSEWDARSPDFECGDWHSPSRLTIHHTVTPTRDSLTPHARMRQMQAYHMDTNGWCDIGYHFVIGGDGRAYQARKREDRTGAHVGGQNTNNVGTSFMGDFTSDIPSDAMLQAGADVQRWMSDTYGIVLNRTNVLGHRENPGQSTSCPGDQLLARLPNIIERATGTVVPPDPEETWDVALDVRVTGLEQRWNSGSSSALADALVGEAYTVEILLENNSSAVIRGVELGYLIENPWVTATHWRIESDYPALDRATWTLNSANDEPANPARDGLGASGHLVMHAFSPGETKRVVLEMRATEYSVGAVDHPDVRAWLRNVTGVYGPQDGWDATPGTNEIGRVVRDHVEVDALDADAWLFESTASPADLEGWQACSSGVVADPVLDTVSGALSATLTGGGACFIAPPWTDISTAAWDELVLHVAASTGPRTMAVRWHDAGATWDDERVARFEVAGTGSLEAIVVPLGEHGRWTGRVAGLRIDPVDLEDVGPDTAVALFDVYLQSSATQTTSTPRAPYASAGRVELIGDVPVHEPEADAGADTGFIDAGRPTDDASPETEDDTQEAERDASTHQRDDAGRGSDAAVRTTGCAAAPRTPGLALAAAIIALLARRRRTA